jgi:hypothetical protein
VEQRQNTDLIYTAIKYGLAVAGNMKNQFMRTALTQVAIDNWNNGTDIINADQKPEEDIF